MTPVVNDAMFKVNNGFFSQQSLASLISIRDILLLERYDDLTSQFGRSTWLTNKQVSVISFNQIYVTQLHFLNDNKWLIYHTMTANGVKKVKVKRLTEA